MRQRAVEWAKITAKAHYLLFSLVSVHFFMTLCEFANCALIGKSCFLRASSRLMEGDLKILGDRNPSRSSPADISVELLPGLSSSLLFTDH